MVLTDQASERALTLNQETCREGVAHHSQVPGHAGLGVLATLGVWLRRRLAK